MVVVPDLDTAGMLGADHTAGVLSGIASSVAIARMPGVVKDKHGDDVRDVLRKPDGEKNVRDAIKNAVAWKPNPADSDDDERPEVIVTMNEAAVTDEVVRCLGKLGWDSPWINDTDSESVRLFVRGGVWFMRSKATTLTRKDDWLARDLPQCLVRERTTQACNLVIEGNRRGRRSRTPTRPPAWLTDAVYRRGCYGDAIVFRCRASSNRRQFVVDGSIVQTLGYDRPTGLIFHSSVSFPSVPESPTQRRCYETHC